MEGIPLVDLHAQYLSIKDEIDAAIKTILTTTSFIGGKHVSDFELNFANYTGAAHAIGCANGTDSIEILLKAMHIGPGDEVIVPALSWISTSEAVSSVGAVPVFVDIEENYYTIDTDLIEDNISERTKAIIPVHLYGHPANMPEVVKIAKKYDLKVIEDCAQSHGAKIGNAMTGTFGDAASFSFFPGKNLGAYGDAGAMITNDQALAERAFLIARHGQKERHNHVIEGRNSRLDSLQAAILNVKLPYLEMWTQSRITLAKNYDSRLASAGIGLPKVKNDYTHVFHLYVIRTVERDALREHLKNARIESSVHYPTALPFLPCYQHLKHQPQDFPVAFNYQDKVLSLPMYPELTEEKISYIAERVKEFTAVKQ